VRTWSDDMLPDARLSEAPIILGYSAPQDSGGRALPSVYSLFGDKKAKIDSNLHKSFEKVKKKAKNYRMLGFAGTAQNALPQRVRLFNDLEGLDPTYRPVLVAIWADPNIVRGVEFRYANGERKSHGVCDEKQACYWISLQTDEFGTETIFEMQFGTTTAKILESATSSSETQETIVGWIRLTTSKYRTLDTDKGIAVMLPSPPAAPKSGEEVTEDQTTRKPKSPTGEYGEMDTDSVIKPENGNPKAVSKELKDFVLIGRPDVGFWSVRGFFGFVKGAGKNTRFLSLGVVYGQDKFVPRPPTPEILPISKSYANLLPEVQKSIFANYGDKKDKFPGYFIMGDSVAAATPVVGNYFNHLRDIGIGWQIKDIVFAAKAGKLTGLKTTWVNGVPNTQGDMGGDNDKAYSRWKLDLATDNGKVNLLISGKITQVLANTASRIQTVEFVRSEDSTGSLPPWLLDISTLRYLGDSTTTYTLENTVVEPAPTYDNAVWSVRGFYGGTQDGAVAHLGFIWGRDK